MKSNLEGMILKCVAGRYFVAVGDAVYECSARGIFRNRNQTPLVGDKVEIKLDDDNTGMIEGLITPKNSLVRPPISNIDRLYIVISVAQPGPNLLVIDKLIAIAEDNYIEPVIIISKTDLGDCDDLSSIYVNAGFEVYPVSCITGMGIEEVLKSFSNGINVFTGNSGVGKSSILNLIDPRLSISTGEISQKLGRGRHTTRVAQLHPLKRGGYVADTPGFSSLDLVKGSKVKCENLQFAFREFAPALGKCQFSSCSHINDKGCEVKKLLLDGHIEETRYQSYVTFYNEMKNVNDWD